MSFDQVDVEEELKKLKLGEETEKCIRKRLCWQRYVPKDVFEETVERCTHIYID